MLDSGEADTWRYEQGQWQINDVHKFAEGNEKRPWKKASSTASSRPILATS